MTGQLRFATLWDEIDCTSVRDRLTGHKQALTAHNTTEDADFTVLRSSQTMSPPDRRAFLSSLLRLADPPSALLCAHGYVLATVMQDLVEIDAGTFDRINLASMDGYTPFDIAPYAAAGTRLPSKQMGLAAIDLLHEAIIAPDHTQARHVVLPIEVREGGRDSHMAHQFAEQHGGGPQSVASVRALRRGAGQGPPTSWRSSSRR